MKRSIERKSEIVSLIYFIFALGGLALFLRLFLGYNGPGYYYHPVTEGEMGLKNAVGRISIFTYFSYLSLFINSIWGILLFFSTAIGSKKAFDVLNDKYLLTFVTLNQIVTMVVYLATQCFVPYPFGITKLDLSGFFSFLIGFYIHFVMPITMIIYYFFFAKPKNLQLKKCLWLLVFPLVYALIVKFLGEIVYKIEWYPYPVFSVEAIWNLLFKTTASLNVPLAVTLICLCCVFVAVVYFLLVFLMCKLSRKKSK